MAKTTNREYVVFRHGCNSANQSMTPVMPVGIWTAGTRQAAIDAAHKDVMVYDNQYLTARAASKVSGSLYEAATEADALRLMANGANLRG